MRTEAIVRIFNRLTKVPRCSGRTTSMRRWLVATCESMGYHVETDAIGNVMARGEGSRLTLQCHYDMVCIGKAPRIETIVEEGWMRAIDSSLGADNGMGMAIALYLMEKKAPVDVLFTNDEEIGLIGAGGLELSIRTPYLLNLDSEELGKVTIGCAGGEDVFTSRAVSWERSPTDGRWYDVTATAPGGHSGVNIADDIPNAITEICATLTANAAMKLAFLEGGERINAIPRGARAKIWLPAAEEPIVRGRGVTIESSLEGSKHTLVEGMKLAEALFGFAHGVRSWNERLDLPQNSVNLASVVLEAKRVDIALSARSMANEELSRLVEQCVAGWEALGFSCRREGKYPAWKPEINPFSEKLLTIYRRFSPQADYAAIHAGLECALFAERFPGLQIASIGPTILDPHSDRERVDLESVGVVTAVVESLVEDLSSL